MRRKSRLASASLNARAFLLISKGIWRLWWGRPPWRSGRAERRRRNAHGTWLRSVPPERRHALWR
jgi:hypothetical protein